MNPKMWLAWSIQRSKLQGAKPRASHHAALSCGRELWHKVTTMRLMKRIVNQIDEKYRSQNISDAAFSIDLNSLRYLCASS